MAEKATSQQQLQSVEEHQKENILVFVSATHSTLGPVTGATIECGWYEHGLSLNFLLPLTSFMVMSK